MALDVGERRVGVAIASAEAKLARPYATLAETININQDIANLVASQQVSLLVIGLPLNMEADDTKQTLYIRRFAERLKQFVSVPIVFQDEADTSKKAEAQLRAAKKPYQKSDIDALAAAYILQDYMDQQLRNQNG